MSSDKNKDALRALCEIATGHIVGEPKSYKDTLNIVRKIAKDALKEQGIDIDVI